jgi:hypothetical protein
MSIETATTDFGPERLFLSGLFARSREFHRAAIEILEQLAPNAKRPSISEGGTLSERASIAAYGVALALTVEAMGVQGKPSLDNQKAVFECAIGLVYAALLHCLKNNGVDLKAQPLASGFAKLFVQLNDAQRTEIVQKGMALYSDMIGPGYPKVKDWHDTLLTLMQVWLVSATSEKRTVEQDNDLKMLFSQKLQSLYSAVKD